MNTIKEFFLKDRYAAHSGIELMTVCAGYAKARMKIGDCHLNAGNVVQGGAIFTLADFAFAAAINAYGNLSLSVQTSIYFHKGIGEGVLYAEAKAANVGKSIACFEVKVVNEADDLIATFVATAYRRDIPLPFRATESAP
jgi:acyl-CoA thioesterase